MGRGNGVTARNIGGLLTTDRPLRRSANSLFLGTRRIASIDFLIRAGTTEMKLRDDERCFEEVDIPERRADLANRKKCIKRRRYLPTPGAFLVFRDMPVFGMGEWEGPLSLPYQFAKPWGRKDDARNTARRKYPSRYIHGRLSQWGGEKYSGSPT